MRQPSRVLCRALLCGIALAAPIVSPASQPALAAEVKLDAAQQDAAAKLKAKGAGVMQLAADSDALAVNLGMAGKAAGDAELALVKALPKVAELDLRGTAVTDAGLANIAGLTNLTRLHLERTGVTDEGLAHLKGLSSLAYLNLYETAVTDKGVAQLGGLKALRKLYLWQTKVTPEGAKALSAAIPELIVNRGEELAIVAATPAPAPPAAAPKADDAKVQPGKPINAICPVSDKPVDAQFTVAFEGKTIGFCCNNCPKAFAKDAKKFVAKIPEFKSAPAATPVAKTAKLEPGDLKLDDEGFVRAWLLLAPIPLASDSPAEELDKEQLAKEKDLRPKEGDKAKAGDKELVWKPVKAAEYFFDINEALGEPQSNVAAYAVVYLESEAEHKGVTLSMSSNDQGKAFLNGKEVAKNAAPRGIEKDQDKAEGLTLVKGTNVVVLKVINESNNWQGALRFTMADGKPVKDLKVKLAPPAPPAAAAAAPVPPPPAPAAAGNLLKPTGDPSHWRLEQHEGGKGTAAGADGGLVFDVTAVTGTEWHVQAFQPELDLKDGKAYVVKFKAKSDPDRSIRVQAGVDGNDYHTVGLDEEVALGKEWKNYEYPFTAADTLAGKNRLGFVLGGAKGKVFVKDVVLTAK